MGGRPDGRRHATRKDGAARKAAKDKAVLEARIRQGLADLLRATFRRVK